MVSRSDCEALAAFRDESGVSVRCGSGVLFRGFVGAGRGVLMDGWRSPLCAVRGGSLLGVIGDGRPEEMLRRIGVGL